VPGVASAEYLASWLNRYPFSQRWIDDETNAACRTSEARWIRSISAGETPSQERLAELVRR
jgi:hypothetical protein